MAKAFAQKNQPANQQPVKKPIPFPAPITGQPAWGSPSHPPPSAQARYLQMYFAHRHWLWLKATDQVAVYGHLTRASGDKELLELVLARGTEASLNYQRQRRWNVPHLEADRRVIEEVLAPQAGGEHPDPLPGTLAAAYRTLVDAFEKGVGRILVQDGAE